MGGDLVDGGSIEGLFPALRRLAPFLFIDIALHGHGGVDRLPLFENEGIYLVVAAHAQTIGVCKMVEINHLILVGNGLANGLNRQLTATPNRYADARIRTFMNSFSAIMP
ncbi:hypothetical protein [Paracoccus sp. (in: a-proteobacteria)]|uniref:hypothetical protein n=1 Tax=Paracoccus sp. TaxID=267 RepID=UPI0028ACB169|nr:hypothetical protein [Paracoccus sp. (in: a-proteobacteria)]